MTDRLQLVRDCYHAYETNDRALVESVLADGYTFSAPPDPLLDRDGYFERCWPGADQLERFEFVRLAEVGGEVLVTYEATRSNGTGFRNTEIFGFDGEKIGRTEVYFGWDLDAGT